MTYGDFLERAVDLGISAAKRDYSGRSQKAKLEGSIDGFEACRRKTPTEIAALCREAGKRTSDAKARFHLGEISSDEYWKTRCREAEIEWIANVVSVVLVRDGNPPIVSPTVRAALLAQSILSGEAP
jgi:hypothetical protein